MNTPYYSKAEADQKNKETFREVERTVNSISAGEGGIVYATLAEAQGLATKPSNGTIFQVSKITDAVNAGYYTFQSAEPNGTRFEKPYLELEKGPSINLFNKDDLQVGYVDATNGTISSDADSRVSSFIPVEPNTNYYMSGRSGNNGLSFWDASTNVLPPTEGSDYTSGNMNGMYTSPTNAAYVVFTVQFNGNGSIETTQFEKGISASEYTEFGDTVKVTQEGLPKIPFDLLEDSLKLKLLSDANKYKLNFDNFPLKPELSNINNAVKGLYNTEVNVPQSMLDTIDMSDESAEISSLTRIYNDHIGTKYNRPNAIRVHKTYNVPTDKYSPSLIFRISKEDLKSVGINVDATNYATQYASIRTAIENIVGITGDLQLYVSICYRKDPYQYSKYTLSEPLYIVSGTGTSTVNGSYWSTENPTLNFTANKKETSENGAEYRFLEQIPIHKEVQDGTTTKGFKGIIISFLPSGSNSDTILERGYDVHSIALTNASIHPSLDVNSDLLNRPEDIIIRERSTTPSASPKVTNEVTVQNSDKIAFYGCSYTESAYAVQNKSWVNKIGQMTDWMVANFGQSGNRITDEVERLRSNDNRYHSTIGVKELAPTLISFANIGNETLNSVNNLDMYRQEFLYASQHVKSLGAEMVIGTDHHADPSEEMLLYGLAKELNIDAAPIGTVGKYVLENGYSGFWGGGHPATRTNAHTFLEWMHYINQLPRPKKGIKVFRPRTEYKGGTPTVEELSYDSINQRVKLFQEIGSGENSLSDNSLFYDRLDEGYNITNRTNEYCNLVAKQAVNFNGFGLVEFIIDKLKPDTVSIKIATSVAPDEVFIADNNAIATQYDENRNGEAFKVTKTVYNAMTDPIGTEYTSTATGADVLTYQGKVKGKHLGGYWLFFNSPSRSVGGGAGTLSKSDGTNSFSYSVCSSNYGRHQIDLFENYEKPWSRFVSIPHSYDGVYITINLQGDSLDFIQFDKIKVLVKKTGTFSINDLSASYTGGEDKKQIATPIYKLKDNHTELNTYEGFGTDWETTGGWINDGAELKQMPVSLRDYPPMHTKNNHIELGYDAVDGFSTSIKKTFNLTGKRKGVSKVVIRAVARTFPKVYDTTVAEDEYHTQTPQITPDSYDMATLVCLVKHNGNHAPMKRVVDIGWSEVYFETYLPATNGGDFTVELYRDEADVADGNPRNHLYPMQVYDVSVQLED